jgi:RNA polymerase sigma-70 factor (ECF subfamily)
MICEAALWKDLAVDGDDEAARLKRGDPAAIAGAVGRYHHRLYRYLYRLVRDPAAAEDLYQQTWLNVVRRIGSYDGHRSFDTWLFAIAHNAAMDLLRRKTGESLEDGEFAVASETPDALASAMSKQRAEIVDGQLAKLPLSYREAITLRFEEGMKLEEIAEVTRTPLSTVKSRMQRGMESLRQKIAAQWRKEDLL